MRGMEAESVDAVVTDPPYGLEFMGKEWDHGIPGVPFWEAALRVAKPGTHLLAFGGTRIHHRLMCAIEDAGWEIRDCLMWVYGSGFPKSLDVGKAIDKAAGAERDVVQAISGPRSGREDSTQSMGDMG
jgi:site-specific DNA-methyltransferase (adenine-specific)